MKILLFTGLEALDDLIQRQSQESHEVCIVDTFEQLELDSEDADALIVNRYMDETDSGEQLQRTIKRMRQSNKNLQIIIMMDNPEKVFINVMVSIGVFDIVICKAGESLESISMKLLKAIEVPARAFNFDLLKESEFETERNIKDETIKVPKKVRVESVFKQIITVYSPTNAGATELVEDLATALTKHKKCKVLIIDLNTLNPSLSMKLNKTGKEGLHELLDAYEKGAPLHEIEDQYLNKVGDVYLLSNNFNYNHCYYLKTELLESLIIALQRHYDYIILDTNPYLNDAATQTALKVATQTYIAVLPNQPNLNVSVGYMKLIREEIKNCHISGVIVNRFSGFCLTSIEIESILDNTPISYIQIAKANMKKGFRAKRYYKYFSSIVSQIEGGRL